MLPWALSCNDDGRFMTGPCDVELGGMNGRVGAAMFANRAADTYRCAGDDRSSSKCRSDTKGRERTRNTRRKAGDNHLLFQDQGWYQILTGMLRFLASNSLLWADQSCVLIR